MKWIIAILTVIGIVLLGIGVKDGSDVTGWQDRENSAMAYGIAIIVFLIDAVCVIGWLLWEMFT